jgi:hypothetical protein
LWAVKTIRKAASLEQRVINHVKNWSWPRVLLGYQTLGVKLQYPPGIKTTVNEIWKSGGYDGPCNAETVETWTADIPTTTVEQIMVPTPIRFDGMFINVNTPSCLHGSHTFSEVSGTDNTQYMEQFSQSYTVDATNVTDWPEYILVSGEPEHHKGGWLNRIVKIYRPY